MKGMRLMTATLLPTLVLGGCVSTARVKERPPGSTSTTRLEGIPFFLKTEEYRQTTGYQVAWREVSLTQVTRWTVIKDSEVKITEAREPVGTRTAAPEDAGLEALRRSVLDLNAEGGNPTELERLRKAVIDAFLALRPPDLATLPAELVANVLEPVLVVNYERELYLNAPLPWFGSSTLTTKLGSDGTLNEATATADSDLAEALTSFLPIKEFLTAKHVATLAPDDAEETVAESSLEPAEAEALLAAFQSAPFGKVTVQIRMELTIEPRGWIYTFTANHAQDPRKNCGLAPAMTTGEEPRCTLEPIPLDQSEAYRRVALGAGSGDAKKTPGKTIEISGEVLVPKE